MSSPASRYKTKPSPILGLSSPARGGLWPPGKQHFQQEASLLLFLLPYFTVSTHADRTVPDTPLVLTVTNNFLTVTPAQFPVPRLSAADETAT